MPCLLVENNVDLISPQNENDPTLQIFAKNNGFCGAFRTSSKTGFNVDESMEYLIRIIIKRIKDWQFKGNEDFTTNRVRFALNSEKKNQTRKNTKKVGCIIY